MKPITATQRIATFFRRIADNCPATGLAGSVKKVAHFVLRRTKRAARYLTEWQIDRRYGITTRGRYFTNDTHELHGERHPYQPVPLNRLIRIIDSLGLQPTEWRFIDLGSGMGGALIVAAKMGFRSLIGVEFDYTLTEIARGNVASLRLRDPESASRITLLHQDAGTFVFPDDAPLVVFLFNPFGPETMRTVMTNLTNSLARAPRTAFLVYYYPTESSVIGEFPLFVVISRNAKCAIYRYGPS